jgi:hypothetical protein
MSDAAQAFARALEEERTAALRADFETLLRVQEDKRALLPLLKATAEEAVVHDLSERARKNILLLRQLLGCVQGALGISAEPTYTASGQSASLQPVTQPTVKGRL